MAWPIVIGAVVGGLIASALTADHYEDEAEVADLRRRTPPDAPPAVPEAPDVPSDIDPWPRTSCGQCDHCGYLLDQGYGAYPLPEGAVPVQSCDACGGFGGDDLEAARAAAFDLMSIDRRMRYAGWHAHPSTPAVFTVLGDAWVTARAKDGGPLPTAPLVDDDGNEPEEAPSG